MDEMTTLESPKKPLACSHYSPRAPRSHGAHLPSNLGHSRGRSLQKPGSQGIFCTKFGLAVIRRSIHIRMKRWNMVELSSRAMGEEKRNEWNTYL